MCPRRVVWLGLAFVSEKRSNTIFINMDSNLNKAGALGEQLVSEALSKLPPAYHQFDNLVVPVRHRKCLTTQIDHVVASPFGIFVIETKKFKGCIYGLEADRDWVQILGSRRFPFRNPVVQNRFHATVLADHLGSPSVTIMPVVVFVGTAQLLSPQQPGNVISTIAPGVPDLRRYIEGFTSPLITQERLSTVLAMLARIKSNGLTLENHLASIRCRDLHWRVNAVLRLNGALPL